MGYRDPADGRPIGAAGPASEILSQLSDRNAKGIGNPLDIAEGQISFAPLDSADVGPVELAFVGEILLGPTPRMAQFAHSLTKPHEDVDLLRHPDIVAMRRLSVDGL